jgi:hypothetical protein
VADELGRLTGEKFDVHGTARDEVFLPGREMGNPNRRWFDEIRPRREAILQKLEPFRSAGHKSLEARVRVTPTAAERPHWLWNLEHLKELTVVSRLELEPTDARGETEIVIDEAPGPECPRCWRRLGDPSGAPIEPALCRRCAAVVTGGAS